MSCRVLPTFAGVIRQANGKRCQIKLMASDKEDLTQQEMWDVGTSLEVKVDKWG